MTLLINLFLLPSLCALATFSKTLSPRLSSTLSSKAIVGSYIRLSDNTLNGGISWNKSLPSKFASGPDTKNAAPRYEPYSCLFFTRPGPVGTMNEITRLMEQVHEQCVRRPYVILRNNQFVKSLGRTSFEVSGQGGINLRLVSVEFAALGIQSYFRGDVQAENLDVQIINYYEELIAVAVLRWRLGATVNDTSANEMG